MEVFFDSGMSIPVYQISTDYGKLEQSVWMKEIAYDENHLAHLEEPQCQQFSYGSMSNNVRDALTYLWTPNEHHFTAYIGEVCMNLDNEYREGKVLNQRIVDWYAGSLNDVHAFIGSDSSGNQFTFFVDKLGNPLLSRYKTQTLHFLSINSMTHFKDEHFEVNKCKDRVEQINDRNGVLGFHADFGLIS